MKNTTWKISSNYKMVSQATQHKWIWFCYIALPLSGYLNTGTQELAREVTLVTTIKHANDAGLPLSTPKYKFKLGFTREADSS